MPEYQFTHWMDVKSYTGVTITCKGAVDNTTYIYSNILVWGQGSEDSPPYEDTDEWELRLASLEKLRDEVARDITSQCTGNFTYTFQYPIRSRWLMIATDKNGVPFDVTVSYTFTKSPTQITFRDTSNAIGIMASTLNAAHVFLTDSSGERIGTTHFSGNALYTHLADGSGDSLAIVNQSLAISLRDGSNNPVGSTKALLGNSMYATITNSMGHQQASTEEVVGADRAGYGLYYALADACGNPFSTTLGHMTSPPNAMYVHMMESSGSVTTTNRIPVVITGSVSQGLYTFDTAVEASMTFASSDLSNAAIKLRTLGIANEYPVTIWVRVYDICTGAVTGSSTDLSYSIFNLPVPAAEFRDIYISRGINFTKGLCFRVTHGNIDASAGRVYVMGSYTQ